MVGETPRSVSEPQSVSQTNGRRDRYVNEFAPLLSASAAMLGIKHIVDDIADTDAIVLICGESGVGKDFVARAIHEASARHDGPFVKVNCARSSLELLESLLFGHEKGAFGRRKLGQCEYANKGTIYLDDIGERPLASLASLMRFLRDCEFTRNGGRDVIRVDARVVATPDRGLECAIARADFRDELFSRLNLVEVHVPPLRERREEIPLLAARFLARFSAQYGQTRTLSQDRLAELMKHSWPGNVRELEDAVRRLAVLAVERTPDAPRQSGDPQP